jgi:hypothetical protein
MVSRLPLVLLLVLFFFPFSSFCAPEICPFSLGPLSFQLCFNDYGYSLGRCPSTPSPTSLNGASILIIAGSKPGPLKYTCTTDCAITCIGEEACKGLELTCSGNCAIHCEGSGKRVCQDLRINTTGNLVIDCQGKIPFLLLASLASPSLVSPLF